MMKFFYLSVVIFLVLNTSVISQGLTEERNKIDENGLKQGYWESFYPNGKIQYRGDFKDNRPVGLFVRYFPSGNKMAEMNFCDEGRRSMAEIYHESGVIAARGIYIDEKKDSVWSYFTGTDARLTSTETYVNGLKQGLSATWYPNGKHAETFWYENDLRNGPWNQFYDSGRLKVRSAFKDGQREGEFIFYTNEGRIEIKGNYRNNQMHGDWSFFDGSGQLMSVVVYNEGRPENEEAIIDQEQIMFRRIEEMRGKIPEPDESDMFSPVRY
jgi:antitoxin component YwqK of YwqJK toxin-antitoxin module